MALLERYLHYVDRRGPDECWPWTGSTAGQDYGYITVDNRRIRAHRLGYTLLVGPIPDGLCVLHTCDFRLCQNPQHWFLGTQADNVADMEAKGRGRRIFGEANKSAKLSTQAVKEIRRLAKKGVPQRAIAKEFNIRQATVSRIVSGKQRCHD